MSITGAIVLYATLWFLCLFLMLPIGHRSQDDAGSIVPGTHAGAPADAMLVKKAVWATVLSGAIFAVLAYVILAGIVTRADVTSFNPLGV